MVQLVTRGPFAPKAHSPLAREPLQGQKFLDEILSGAARSSNGRTPAFGAGYDGSNPSLAAPDGIQGSPPKADPPLAENPWPRSTQFFLAKYKLRKMSAPIKASEPP